jgi:hypothetical protein
MKASSRVVLETPHPVMTPVVQISKREKASGCQLIGYTDTLQIPSCMQRSTPTGSETKAATETWREWGEREKSGKPSERA